MEASVYWIELVIDDDSNPDFDAYPQKLECEKCTVYSNSDDPAVRDWLKVIVIPVNVQLFIHPDEPSILSADDGEAFIAVGVWVYDPNHPDEWVEAEDGSEIRWEITEGNEGIISPTISYTRNGHAVTKLTTNRVAGNRYQVKATLTKLVYKGVVYHLRLSITTDVITVVPGRANQATLHLDRLNLPADERSIASAQVTFQDTWGNLVEDSSPVFFSLKGFSSLIGGDSAYTTKGSAQNQTRAGFLPSIYGIVATASTDEGTAEGEKLEVELDDVREVRSLSLIPLRVEVMVEKPILTVGNGERTTVIAKVTDIFGRPVPDGTPVYWFSSAGSVTPRETMTSNGIAIATLSTASNSPLLHERFADGMSVEEKVLVTATVPGNFVGCAEVIFARNPNHLTVRPRHILLAGDVIGQGLINEQGNILPEGYEQVEEVFWVGEEGIERQVNIPYYASTILDIWGYPNERVKVQVFSDLVALLDGMEVKSEVTIQLNEEGYGKVILVSTGKLSVLEADVEVIVTSEPSQPFAPLIAANRQGKAVIRLTFKSVFARLLGLAWRLTGWRGVGRALASVLGIGDVFTILYEVGKILPGGEKPDWVNVGFAAASLLTSASSVTGVGAFFEVLVNIADLLQRAFKRLGGVRGINFAAKLTKVFQELLSKWDESKGIAVAKLLDGLMSVDDETIGVVSRIVGNECFEHLMKISQKLEVAQLKSLMEKSKAIGEAHGDEIARRVLSVLWELDEAVVKELVTSLTAMENIAIILKGGKISNPVQLRNVLGQQKLFTETYTRVRFLEELAAIANAENLDRVLKEMTKKVYGFQKGALYEVHVGYWLQEEGKYGKVLRFREGLYLKVNESITGKPYRTDADIILEGNIFVQAKAGPISLPSDDKQAEKIFQAKWLPLIHAYKTKGASKIIFAFGDYVDKRLEDYLKDAAAEVGVQVEVIKLPYPGG